MGMGMGMGTGGAVATGSGGGNSGSSVCAPGVVGPVITDCGYPYTSANARTSVVFNESEVLRAILPSGGAPLASVRLFYNDENALTLGVRSVVVKSSSGTSSADFPVSPLLANPDSKRSPQTGSNAISGDLSGLDPSNRPMWPALFITDTTVDPNDRSGDWQLGGAPFNPTAVFGTWKAAVRNVDKTVNPNVADITPDADPDKNGWNIGRGDPIPAAVMASKAEAYTAEVRWDLVLIAGHSYRMQVMVHDGDQNKVGGDSGEACVNFCAGSACPEGSPACGPDAACPIETESVCINGCCI